MRAIGLLVTGALSIIVVAEGGYIMKTRKQMDALEERLQRLADSGPRWADDDRLAQAWAPRPQLEPDRQAEGADRAPPPRFVASPPTALRAAAAALANANGNPLPLPSAIDSAEAREQLRQFVLAQLQRQRDEEREKQNQRREEAEQQRRDDMAKKLGLSADESKRFSEALSAMQTAMREARDKIDQGKMTREQAGPEFRAARERADQQLRGMLGDDRMKQFQEMQRSQGGGWGGGRRGGGGGPPGGGGPGPG